MSTISAKKNKHLILTQSRIDKAKQIVNASTETETIEIALERLIEEDDRNKDLWVAHDTFVRSIIAENIEIEDVFGNLREK
jgi:signal-transduction protein with cAMP-binding, CBS, and nucleotidyltransferase domain